MMLRKTECSCDACQAACRHTPGWFRPGEAEKAAAFLGLSMSQLFRRYLGVNWWVATNDVFVLAPAIRGEKAGREYPADPRGECVFFADGKCRIHPAKPYECAHGNPHDSAKEYEAAKAQRARTVALWKKQQSQITRLLGRKPRSKSLSFAAGFLGLFFGGGE